MNSIEKAIHLIGYIERLEQAFRDAGDAIVKSYDGDVSRYRVEFNEAMNTLGMSQSSALAIAHLQTVAKYFEKR